MSSDMGVPPKDAASNPVLRANSQNPVAVAKALEATLGRHQGNQAYAQIPPHESSDVLVLCNRALSHAAAL